MILTSDNVQENLNKIREIFDNHNKVLGIGNLLSKNNVEYYLNIDNKKIAELSTHQCIEAAVILSRYSIFLQQQYNRLSTVIQFCNNEMHRIVSEAIINEFDQYTPYKYRRLVAIQKNPIAQEYYNIIKTLKIKLGNIFGLKEKIEELSIKFEKLAYFKKYNEDGDK